MKKIIAIMFLTVIGVHFTLSTAYAAGLYHNITATSNALPSNGSNKFIKFEMVDGYEDVCYLFSASLSESFTTLVFHSPISHYALSIRPYACTIDITHPIYLSNHVLII